MRKPLPAMVFLGLIGLAGTSFANNNESFRGISFAIGPSSVSVNTVVTTTGVAWAEYDGGSNPSGGGTYNGFIGNAYQFDDRTTSQPQKYLPRLEIGYNFAIDQSSILGITISKDFGKTGQRWDLVTSANVNSDGTLAPDDYSVNFRGDNDTGYSTLEGPLAIGLKAGYAFTNSTMAYLKISYNQAKFVPNRVLLGNSTFNNGEDTKTLDGAGLALGFESNLSKHIFLRGELEAIHYRSAKINGYYCLTDSSLCDPDDPDDEEGARWTDKYELRQHAGRLLLGVRF
jgi:hypothetical protein